MTSLVIDASVAVKWFTLEADSDPAKQVLRSGLTLLAPRLIVTEVANALARKVAAKLARPRSQWPVEELIERCLQVIANPVVVDRRLAELGPHPRRLLSFTDLRDRGVPYGMNHLRRLWARGDFPPPTKISPRRNVWAETVVDEWIEKKLAGGAAKS